MFNEHIFNIKAAIFDRLLFIHFVDVDFLVFLRTRNQ
jgi:hypothetical protein